jgi:type IV pilus assembly protein PilW
MSYLSYYQKIKKFKSNGVTLIELLIAVTIGLFVMAALLQLFTNFSRMNTTQRGLANIQENGRFIAAKIKMDAENVGYQPCVTVSIDSPQLIDRGFAKRPLINYTNAAFGLPTGAIDPQYFTQGHECDDTGECTPALKTFPGGDPSLGIPAAGDTAGSRAFQTDVLTLRYLSNEAAFINDTTSVSTALQFTLDQDPTSPPLSLEKGNKILIANCHKSMIVTAEPATDNKVLVTSSGASVSWASKASFTSV